MPAKTNLSAIRKAIPSGIVYSCCAKCKAQTLSTLIALCSISLVFTAGIANAGDLDIDTGNVQMSLGQDGVFIRNAPVFPVGVPVYPIGRNENFKNNQNSPRRIRNYRTNRVLKCRNVSQRRHSLRGGSRIITSATTTVCN
ncbi:MAG: hypothetical protein HC903_26720 [Methylacidiphilales bacterium]|nr:hypothetical protein [Candidatus Methylacidiphilales bacterium]NJR15538.1 hypothetical protein [Calothrix sp. CSU_2_0]